MNDITERLRHIRRDGCLCADKPKKAALLHPICQEAADEIERLRAEVADLKRNVVAFAGPWAAQYSKTFGLPKDHLHPAHYDLLERCGARMDSFKKAALRGQG